jgi:hypothetical protein
MRLSLRTRLSGDHRVIRPSHPLEPVRFDLKSSHKKQLFLSRTPVSSPSNTLIGAHNLPCACLRILLIHRPPDPIPYLPIKGVEYSFRPRTEPIEVGPTTEHRIELPDHPISFIGTGPYVPVENEQVMHLYKNAPRHGALTA